MALPVAVHKVLRWAAISLLALIVVLAALIGALHTRAGLDFAAEKAARALSGEGTRVEIGTVTGSIASALEIEGITVADSGGVYARAEGLRFAWNPWALFGRVLEIESLTLARVAVSRLPESAKEPETDASITLPPFGIRAHAIVLEEIDLAQPVLGEAQRIAAKASLRIDKNLRDGVLKLSLRRTDGGPDRADVELGYAADTKRLTAKVEIEEPKGGMLARIAGFESGTPLSVRLDGEGPADAWRGQLTANVGGDLSADSAVLIAVQDEALKLAVDGEARFAALLPERYRPLAAGPVKLEATAEFQPGTALTVTGLKAESTVLDISGSGRYGLQDDRVKATLSAKAKSGETLAGVIPGVALTDPEVEARIKGPVGNPGYDVTLQTGRVSAGSVRADQASGTFSLAPRPGGGFGAKVRLSLANFYPGTALPEGLLGPKTEFSAAGILTQAAGLEGVTATAESGATTIEIAEARLDADAIAGKYTLALKDIMPLAQLAGFTVNGQARADGQIRFVFETTAVKATVEGAFSELAGGPQWRAELLGNRVPFTADIAWQDGRPLEVMALKLTPAAGRIETAGALDFESGIVSAEAQVAIPKLAPLSSLMRSKIEGAVETKATVTGSFDAPRLRGQTELKNIEIDGRALGTLGVGYSVRMDGETVAAALRLRGTALSKPVNGDLKAAWSGSALSLSDIDLTLAGNRVQGRIGFNPEFTRVSGALKAEVKNFARIPGLEDAGIKGGATAQIAADPDGEGAIDVTATLRGLKAPGAGLPATVDTAEVKLRVTDPLGGISLSGEAKVAYLLNGMSAPGQGTFTIDGTPDKFDWGAEIAMARPYKTEVAVKGSAALGDAMSRIDIASLNGQFENQPLSLQAPITVTLGQGTVRLSPLDLQLAGGRLNATASMEGDALDAEGTIEGIPLKLAALFEPRAAVEGTASGRFRIQGPLAKPVVSAKLTGRDIRPEGADKESVPGFTLEVSLEQAESEARAEAHLTGDSDTALTARFKTPPLLRSGGALADAPIEGEVRARLRLAKIAQIAGLGEDRVAGEINATLAVSGTLGDPHVRGQARLTGGSYEGAATGTILRNLNAEASFDGDELRLVSLDADDGQEGRISAKGAVRLAGKAARQEGLQVTLERFMALRHPTAQLQTTGTVTLAGSVAAPEVRGRLRIDQGEIRIPDRLSEDIVELEVTEINKPAGMKSDLPNEDEPSLAEAAAVALDLTIEVPGQTFVRGRGLDSEWKGNLAITGTSAQPVIKGKLEVVRGTFAFAGKTFVVKSGAVSFPPGGGPEPEIAATAEAKLTDILARVEISGTVSKPEIGISSEPPLPQEDVLAQILFGRTSGQLTALQAAQLVQTAAVLSGKAGGPGIVEKIRSTLGVDVLSVESGGAEEGASLKAGNYLTEDVFLSVSQGTQPGSQKVGVEVEVTPQVTVESNISGNADSNIGVNWKWDY